MPGQAEPVAHAGPPREENARDTPSKPLVRIERMSKAFGSTVALDAVSVSIQPGEFFTIIGPSGSGKTTLLRILGGFETPDSHAGFTLAGVDLAAVPAYRRNIATVFQHYALFPHMTVGRNVEYGLKVRGVPKDERRERAVRALELVRLGGRFERRVTTLSGGERQRVALARAVVTEPALLLLDEPLGALDERLRADMQFELKQLHEQLGIAFVYVTHNQDEALTMSDRLAILHGGKLQQVGSPTAVYESPTNRFVADFMGAANFIRGDLAGVDGHQATVRCGDAILTGRLTVPAAPPVGSPAWVCIRPENVRTDGQRLGNSSVRAVRVAAAYRGAYNAVVFELPSGERITARVHANDAADSDNEAAWLAIDPENALVLFD